MKNKLTTQPQAIQHFIEKMDIEMVDSFLDPYIKYQNFEKYLFISKLQKAFETFKNYGDTHLFTVEGSCNNCNKTKSGFTFIGNISKNYMSIIFDSTDNKINDLYECSYFKNKETNLNLKHRVYIDNEFKVPF